jgi:hypothetical protein
MQEAILVRCPLGTQYDATSVTCDPLAECIEKECTSGSSHLQAYAENSPFFILCDLNKSTGDMDLFVLQCPPEFIFDADEMNCVLAAVITTTTEATTTTSSPTVSNDFRCFSNGLIPGAENFVHNGEILLSICFYFLRPSKL